jgi:ABC-type lipoprotein export system ATPase subunit
MSSLEELGSLIIQSVPEAERGKFHPPIIEGFNNLCLSLESIQEALESHYFDRKFLTAVGKTEWANIKWTDQSIAEKKNIINGADLVFISAESVEACLKTKQTLTESNVNDNLFDCSDAHCFCGSDQKDRIGNCFTWIKADTTFEGLRQTLNEPKDRVFLGDVPPKLINVQNDRTKYINSININRKADATLSEIWFDNKVVFNPGLVAIIGNKGKGKSALSDMIGLLCETKQYNDFTFLSETNFRQQRNNKAKHFEAKLLWESGDTCYKALDDNVDTQRPELVKYIPQHFLENICNQLSHVEESEFDQELKKVIFSHVDSADRLDKRTLDDLLTFKTSEAYRSIEILKQELHRINENIVSLENWLHSENQARIYNLLAQKERELKIHIATPPDQVLKPDADPTKQNKIAEISSQIQKEKSLLAEIEKQIETKQSEQKLLAKQTSTANNLITRLENLEHQIQTFFTESSENFSSIGIAIDQVFTYKTDRKLLTDKVAELSTQKAGIDEALNPEIEWSLEHKKQSKEKMIEKLQSSLDEPNRKYQAYLAAYKKWENRKADIIGNEEIEGTIEYFKKQIKTFTELPAVLEHSNSMRIEKALQIFSIIQQLSITYSELYKPIHEFIKRKSVAIQDYQLNFEVGIVDCGFAKEFFNFISHGLTGSYCGIDEGTKILNKTLKSSDFNSSQGVVGFLNMIIKSLVNDMRPGGKEMEIKNQLKKDRDVLYLYDMIFSLEYLKPRYSLRMGDKELDQLSPGERGTLLLIFYLLLDKSEIPLIIDQPEENLDNQTVYEVLVPCIKEAKQKRQLIMVTHNPNLAVVCDAEQIIHADLDKKNNYVMKYESGAIENPVINRAIVDVLEGTMPAFDNRDAKYFD